MNRKNCKRTERHSNCFLSNSRQQLQSAWAEGTFSVFKIFSQVKGKKVPNLFWNFRSFSQISILFPGLEIEKTNSILFPDFPYPPRTLCIPDITRCRSMMNLSSFHCFVFFFLSSSHQNEQYKSPPDEEQPKETRWSGSMSSSRQQCRLYFSDTAWRKTWHEIRIQHGVWTWRKKKLENLVVAVQQSWNRAREEVLFDPSLLSQCASIRGRYNARFVLASNPGPHRHRIYDRQEEGLGKPPFCFPSLPTIVGKISTQNGELNGEFLTAKNVEVSPGAGCARQGTNKAKPSSSTPQHAHKRRRGQRKGNRRRLFGSEIVDSLARSLQSALNEMFFLSLFLVSFFFCRTFSCREKHQSPVCGSNTSSAQGASGRRGPDLLALFERRDVILAKQCVSSERCAMPKACSVWHDGNKARHADGAFLARFLAGCLPRPCKDFGLFFAKHDNHTDKATNHDNCTNNF